MRREACTTFIRARSGVGSFQHDADTDRGVQGILEHNRLDLGNVLGNDQVLPGVSPMVALTNLHVSANFSELDTLAFGMNFCKYCLAWTGFGLDFD